MPDDKRTSPIVAEFLRNAYLRMSITVEVEGEWLPAHVAVARLSAPLTIITATNQWIDTLPKAIQKSRYSELRQELLERKLEPHRALAESQGYDRAAKAWAVEGLGPHAALKVGRKLGKGVIFRLTRTKLQVLGCSFRWSREREILDTSVAPPLGPTLADAVLETLGVEVAPDFQRASLQGWSHEGKVECSCPQCANELHVFGADLTSRDGVPYRAIAFLCTGCATVHLPPRVPAGCRELVARRRIFCTARRDADREKHSERRYWVYVVELADAVGPREGHLPWVYVGLTSKTPEERLAEHKAGVRHSRYVQKHERGLRPDLYEDQPILRTYDEGRAYEPYLASRLHAQGYPFKGGH